MAANTDLERRAATADDTATAATTTTRPKTMSTGPETEAVTAAVTGSSHVSIWRVAGYPVGNHMASDMTISLGVQERAHCLST